MSNLDQIFDTHQRNYDTLPLYLWLKFDVNNSEIQKMLTIEISWHMRKYKKLTCFFCLFFSKREQK